MWQGQKTHWISYKFYHRRVKSHLPYLRGTAMGSGVLQKKAEAKKPRTELGVPWAVSTFPRKRREEKNVSEQATVWCKTMQVLCFLWKIMSWRSSADLGWWCLDLFFRLCVDHFRDVNAVIARFVGRVSPLGQGSQGFTNGLIQLPARCQDLFSGIKTHPVTSGARLCGHGLKALRNALLRCMRAGFYGNTHQGLGPGYQI